MAGGNSHQRAMEKAAKARLEKFTTAHRSTNGEAEAAESDSMEHKRRPKVLERSSLEAYGAAFLSILAVELPVNWLLKGFFWLVAAILLADISWRSPWTFQLGKQRLTVCIAILAALSCLAVPLTRKQFIEDRAGAIEGDLVGCPPWFSYWSHCNDDGPLMLVIGDSESGLVFGSNMEAPIVGESSAIEGANSFWQLTQDAGIHLGRGKHGFEITTTIKNKNGDVVVEIDKNHWHVTSLSIDKNYTRNTLEVKDNRKHVVLWLRILEDRVQIQGEWRDEFGTGTRLMRCRPPGQKLLGCTDHWNNPQEELRYANNMIEPMFEYPSKDRWGEARKAWPIHP